MTPKLAWKAKIKKYDNIEIKNGRYENLYEVYSENKLVGLIRRLK